MLRPKLRAGTLSLAVLALSGCGLLHRAPQPPPVVILQPPMFFPAPPPAPMPLPTVLVPDTPPAPTWTLALDVAPPPRRPQPRRVPAPAESVASRPDAPEAPPPQLSTALSPQVQTAYRDQTLASLARAQQDLRILAGRRLSGNAAATRAQAIEYVRQAQAALAGGDLVRAQMLSAKAETLARFLLGR